jgi:deazaflavin-dependent oxidoreductase (nitroreductase family)
MREDVRQALAIDASSTIEDRTIDITTTGRRSGEPRRIEIAFYRLGDDIYLSGIPGPKTRNWLANLAAEPRFTFHLKSTVRWPRSPSWRPADTNRPVSRAG